MDWLFNVRDFDIIPILPSRPRVHARVCRSVSGIRTQPGPPRSHARSGWPARRSACRCRRGRVAVLNGCSWPFRGRGAGALAQPSRTGVKRKRRSLGLARAPSETVTQSRAPETAGERSRSDGLAVRPVRAPPSPLPLRQNCGVGCAASPHETSTHRAAARAGAMSDGHTSRPHRAPSHRDAHPTPGPYLTW